MEPISTGILSFGMSGRIFHAPFIAAHPGFSFYGVTERSKKKAQSIYPDIKSFDSADELIADPAVELIIVNTPNNTHYEYAKKALLAGKHVLVEKPFAATSAEAKELFELGRKVDKKVLVYQNRRWDSDYNSVRGVLKSGKLGRLIEMHIRFDRYRKEIGPKLFKETQVPATGLSYDLGSHLLDLVISTFGKPLKSIKTLGSYRPGSQVDDFFHIHLVFSGDVQVFLSSTLLCVDPLPAFVLHGSEGSYIRVRSDVQEAQLDKGMSPLDEAYGIEPDTAAGKLTVLVNGEKQTEYIAPLKGNYMGLFDAVYESVRNGQPYPVKEDEIIWQLEVLEAPSF